MPQWSAFAECLPPGVAARANPKSSTGRVDVFVRLLTDHGAAFDDVAEGYGGPIYMEIAPQTFSILVRTGTRLNQLRLKSGEPPHLETRSVGGDLSDDGIVGFRARRGPAGGRHRSSGLEESGFGPGGPAIRRSTAVAPGAAAAAGEES